MCRHRVRGRSRVTSHHSNATFRVERIHAGGHSFFVRSDFVIVNVRVSLWDV